MANILGQPTIQEISNVMCDQCNAVICLGCPVYELDKHARAQQNAHPTLGESVTSVGVYLASAESASDNNSTHTPARVA